MVSAASLDLEGAARSSHGAVTEHRVAEAEVGYAGDVGELHASQERGVAVQSSVEEDGDDRHVGEARQTPGPQPPRSQRLYRIEQIGLTGREELIVREHVFATEPPARLEPLEAQATKSVATVSATGSRNLFMPEIQLREEP